MRALTVRVTLLPMVLALVLVATGHYDGLPQPVQLLMGLSTFAFLHAVFGRTR